MARTSGTRPIGVPPQQIIWAFFQAEIDGYVDWGTTGQKFRYSWHEIWINDSDIVEAVTTTDQDGGTINARAGSTTERFAINQAELNNTGGADTIQGNGMELVAPIPAGRIVWMREVARRDGTIRAEFDAPNSDHITEASTVTIGSNSNDGGSESAETTAQNFESSQSGKHDEGEALLVNNGHRVGYYRSPGDETLWIYNRAYTFRPNGKLRLISGETRNTVEVLGSCP